MKLLTVIGATGTQGSAVINAMLDLQSEWSIRAITRNPSSAAAEALQAKGVEVVQGDLNDLASLKRGFQGSYAIFAATDFFVPFAEMGANAARAGDYEWTQTSNIIEAASGTDSLQHFLISTFPHAARISGGKYRIPHYEAKNRAEDVIKSNPMLLAKTTFVWVGWYASNFQYPIFKPTLLDTAGQYIHLSPASPETCIYTIGDTKANLGHFVRAALTQPQLTRHGKVILAVTERLSYGELLDAWSRAEGKTGVYVQVSQDSYRRLWPGWGDVEGPMFEYWEAYGDQAWTSKEEVILTKEDLGIEDVQFVTVEQALR